LCHFGGRLFVIWTGLPDFCWYVIPKPEKMYQIDT
jgi:hypothetical protein